MNGAMNMMNTLANNQCYKVPGFGTYGSAVTYGGLSDFAFGNSAFTIEFWMRVNVEDWAGTGGTGYNFAQCLTFGFGDSSLSNSNGRLGMYLDRNRPGVNTQGMTNNPYMNPDSGATAANRRCMVLNRWYHFAIVHDGNSGGTAAATATRLYIDGFFYGRMNNAFSSGYSFGTPSTNYGVAVGGSNVQSYQGNAGCEFRNFKVYKGISLYGATGDTYAANINSASTTKGTMCGAGAFFTGSISGTTLTITSGSVDGTVSLYQILNGAGVAAGTQITAGSGLSWTVSISQTVASTRMSGGCGTFAANYTRPEIWADPINETGKAYLVSDVQMNGTLVDGTGRRNDWHAEGGTAGEAGNGVSYNASSATASTDVVTLVGTNFTAGEDAIILESSLSNLSPGVPYYIRTTAGTNPNTITLATRRPNGTGSQSAVATFNITADETKTVKVWRYAPQVGYNQNTFKSIA